MPHNRVMRLSCFLIVIVVTLSIFHSNVWAQVVLYPNGKRVKILSSRNGANQLAGNQQRYIIGQDREVYRDPKKRELDEREARARMAYPNQDGSEISNESGNTDLSVKDPTQ